VKFKRCIVKSMAEAIQDNDDIALRLPEIMGVEALLEPGRATRAAEVSRTLFSERALGGIALGWVLRGANIDPQDFLD
jgi:hypothetical protein